MPYSVSLTTGSTLNPEPQLGNFGQPSTLYPLPPRMGFVERLALASDDTSERPTTRELTGSAKQRRPVKVADVRS